MISVNQIQKKLYYKYNTFEYHISNAFIFSRDWESDHFCVSKTGYAYEFEIKLSRADFRADFEKPKHVLFSNLKNRYIVRNKGEGRGDLLHVEKVKVIQHYGSYIKTERTYAEATKVEIMDLEKTLIPNRFFFVVPQDLIKVEEVPDYAGLIYVTDYAILVAKDAPLLHKKKNNFDSILVKKFYYRYLPTFTQNNNS